MLLAVLAPGMGHAFLGHGRSSTIILLTALFSILAVCWSRLISQPYGLLLLTSTLVFSFLYSVVAVTLVQHDERKGYSLWLKALYLIVYFALWWGILVGLFHYKKTLLGFEVYQIAANSMEPTLYHGDIILVNTWAYDDADPKYDDVVLFTVYRKNERVMIKRVAALVGDRVAYNREVFRNLGQNAAVQGEGTAIEDKSLTRAVVDADHYFVVGDNLKASRDSRRFGVIAKDNLIGRAVSVIYKGGGGVQWLPQALN